MATKRSATEQLFSKYYHALIFSLPMKNVKFLAELCQAGLIDEHFKNSLESFITLEERASYFLDHRINPRISGGGNANFVKLLTVMKNCNHNHDNVNALAKHIEAECAMDVKCKLICMVTLM